MRGSCCFLRNSKSLLCCRDITWQMSRKYTIFILKPNFKVSKMGSLSSQLRTVAEIRRDKVGHYAHFFRKMYGKFGKKSKKNSLKIAKTQHQITFWGWKLAQTFIPWPSTIARIKFLIFVFLAFLRPFLRSKNGQKWPKTAKNNLNSDPKSRQP